MHLFLLKKKRKNILIDFKEYQENIWKHCKLHILFLNVHEIFRNKINKLASGMEILHGQFRDAHISLSKPRIN